MTNRFAQMALIVLVALVGVVILFVIGLFMFPGITIFGLRYVALYGRAVGTGGPVSISQKLKENYKDNYSGFSGIVINCHEVPVEIVGGDSQTSEYQLEYYENFNGLTTSKISFPSITYSLNDKGNAVIDISGFHKFIYESSTSVRYVKLYVPLREVAVTRPFQDDITINTEKSPISFTKKEGESRIPRYNSVSIKTNNKITFGTKVMANTYNLETNNSILIDKDSKYCVEAPNYNLISAMGSVTVEKDNVTSLKVKTDQGAIKLRGCGNLTVDTSYGNIGYAFLEGEEKEGKGVSVGGSAQITSKAGSVDILKITGGGVPSVITTTSGNIVIDSMYDGTLTTKRGLIDVTKARNITVESNSGKIFVKEAYSGLNAKTARSNIYLGDSENKEKTIKNLNIETRIGKVFVYTATGSVKIKTLSSDVEFDNASSEDITIECGGKITATGLKGTVNVKAEENVHLTFSDVKLGNTTIELGDKCSSAIIYAKENYKDDINYYIKGARVYVLEDQSNNEVILQEDKEYNRINGTTTCKFNVDSKNAVVNICFKNANDKVAV